MSYLRHVRLTAQGSSGGFVINPTGEGDQLKIEFSVTKSISSSQNAATISIYNLEPGHRNSLGKEFDEITLEAGYLDEGNVGIIFKGQLRDVEHTIDGGVDINTSLSCGDGDKAFRKSTISKTYTKGTDTKKVVEDIYKELQKQGIKKGEFKYPKDFEQPLKRPYTVCGSCKRELDLLGRGKSFYWSIQNGTMELIPSDGYIGSVVVLSPDTGLVDVPTITDNGCKVKALLNPEIRPGRRVKVISKVLEMNAKDGEFRVTECTFSGDNREGEFVVQITGESCKAGGKVDEGKKPDEVKGSK